MSKNRIISYLCIICSLVILCTACSSDEEKVTELTGSWAAIYDTKTEVINLKKDGTVRYGDKKYDSYSLDNGWVTLNGKESLKMRYILKDEKVVFYEPRIYTLTETNTPGTIIGLWECGESYFEFNSIGQFLEDGFFSGTYSVDEENGTITLAYEGPFDNTVFYYKLENDTLTAEYPWTAVPTEK